VKVSIQFIIHTCNTWLVRNTHIQTLVHMLYMMAKQENNNTRSKCEKTRKRRHMTILKTHPFLAIAVSWTMKEGTFSSISSTPYMNGKEYKHPLPSCRSMDVDDTTIILAFGDTYISSPITGLWDTVHGHRVRLRLQWRGMRPCVTTPSRIGVATFRHDD
jgi:hypothetical protein